MDSEGGGGGRVSAVCSGVPEQKLKVWVPAVADNCHLFDDFP